jgi:hypothetical protein
VGCQAVVLTVLDTELSWGYSQDAFGPLSPGPLPRPTALAGSGDISQVPGRGRWLSCSRLPLPLRAQITRQLMAHFSFKFFFFFRFYF